MEIVGLSVSCCIRDIIIGMVNDKKHNITKIVAGTKCSTPEDWNEVAAYYSRKYWKADPVRAGRILRKWLKAGIIDQPRVIGAEPPNIADGHWVIDGVQTHLSTII